MSCKIKFKSAAEAGKALDTMLLRQQYFVEECNKCGKYHIRKEGTLNEDETKILLEARLLNE